NDPKRSQAIIDQVSEDFQRILTLHNEIVRAIAANRSLSYQFISEATGEIRKRSARLQSSLKLQKPEAKAENRGTGADLKVMATHQAATAPANLLASTRLNAPIKVGSPFNVERRIRADGNPRRTLRSIFSVRAPSINDQARVIAPPTITASGLKPTIRFEIPMPR